MHQAVQCDGRVVAGSAQKEEFKMPRFDVQKILQQAAEDRLINLDIALGDVVRSNTFSSLVSYEDAWEFFCGNDLRAIMWPGPRRGDVVLPRDVARMVNESIS